MEFADFTQFFADGLEPLDEIFGEGFLPRAPRIADEVYQSFLERHSM